MAPLLRLGGPVLRVIDLQLELAYYQKFKMKPVRRNRGEDGREIVELAFDVDDDNAVSQINNSPS